MSIISKKTLLSFKQSFLLFLAYYRHLKWDLQELKIGVNLKSLKGVLKNVLELHLLKLLKSYRSNLSFGGFGTIIVLRIEVWTTLLGISCSTPEVVALKMWQYRIKC